MLNDANHDKETSNRNKTQNISEDTTKNKTADENLKPEM